MLLNKTKRIELEFCKLFRFNVSSARAYKKWSLYSETERLINSRKNGKKCYSMFFNEIYEYHPKCIYAQKKKKKKITRIRRKKRSLWKICRNFKKTVSSNIWIYNWNMINSIKRDLAFLNILSRFLTFENRQSWIEIKKKSPNWTIKCRQNFIWNENNKILRNFAIFRTELQIQDELKNFFTI